MPVNEPKKISINEFMKEKETWRVGDKPTTSSKRLSVPLSSKRRLRSATRKATP